MNSDMEWNRYLEGYDNYLSSLCFKSGSLDVNMESFADAKSGMDLISIILKPITKLILLPCPHNKRDYYLKEFYCSRYEAVPSILKAPVSVLIELLSHASPRIISFLPRNLFEAHRDSYKYAILFILFSGKNYVRPMQLSEIINNYWKPSYSRRSLFRNLKSLRDRGFISKHSPSHKISGYYLSRNGFEIANFLNYLAKYKFKNFMIDFKEYIKYLENAEYPSSSYYHMVDFLGKKGFWYATLL